jgi:hypothetical protein
MLEAWMDEKYGPKMFFEKIHNYLTKYAYSNTVTLDLYNSLRTKDQNVGEFMSTWTDQPGFPFLTFETVAPNSVSVKQSRFIFSNLVSAIELGKFLFIKAHQSLKSKFGLSLFLMQYIPIPQDLRNYWIVDLLS